MQDDNIEQTPAEMGRDISRHRRATDGFSTFGRPLRPDRCSAAAISPAAAHTADPDLGVRLVVR